MTQKKSDLESRVSLLAKAVERLNVSEYVALMYNPWRVFWINLLAGVARGMGYLIGFALLGTVVVYFLKALVARNLPWIGDFIADLVRLVESQTRR